MIIGIRVFKKPVYGEVDGEWQITGESRFDESYEVTGDFEEGDIFAIRQCIYCFAKGDDLYETKLDEALEHTEVIELPVHMLSRINVVYKNRGIFVKDEELPKRWMVA